MAAPEHRPQWVRVDRLLGEHGLAEDSASARRQFEKRLEQRRWEQTDPEAMETLRRCWSLGSLSFKKEMLSRMQGSLGGHHAGKLHRDVAEVRADRILAEELARHGWDKPELLKRRKNDLIKLEIAARLRRETTLSIKEIAARVQLGTSKAANANLHRHMRKSVTLAPSA